MLEILFLIFLTGRIGKIVEAKGHKSGKYKFYTVLLWVGGEIVGAFLGVAMAGGSSDAQCLVYIVALLGAAAGAGIAFAIANGAPNLNWNKPALETAGVPAAAVPGMVPSAQPGDAVKKLEELKRMQDSGLISAQEYESKKADLLSKM